MKTTERRLDDIIVVDANSDDYDILIDELRQQNAQVNCFATGEAALRAVDACPSTLWMINSRLPDMSGVGLLTLVRRRHQRSSVFLVDDAYSAEHELAARLAGATAYLCKPPTMAWLDGYVLEPQMSGRGGPTRARRQAPAMRPP